MASSYNIETLVEDAIVTLLKEEGLNAERWEDAQSVNLAPIVKVACTQADEEDGTLNTYSATRCIVDIACFTSKKMDLKGRTANANRSTVRSLFADTANIVTRLNGVNSALSVYDNGAYPQGTFDASDEKNHGKGASFMVVCLTV